MYICKYFVYLIVNMLFGSYVFYSLKKKSLLTNCMYICDGEKVYKKCVDSLWVKGCRRGGE